MARLPPASKARSQNGKAKASLIADDDLDILGEDEWEGTATGKKRLGHELEDDGDGNDEGEKNDDYYEMEAGSGEDEQEGYEED